MTASPRYVTWRYADRRYSKVHILTASGTSVCGKTPGREIGRPKEPIPDAARCEECSSQLTEG